MSGLAVPDLKPAIGPEAIGPEALRSLSDDTLARRIRLGVSDEPALVHEYYRRCIPVYESILGLHWHTGWYERTDRAPTPQDQERMIAILAASAQLQAGMRVLDVGCGIGGTVAWLARQVRVEAVGITPVLEQKWLADQQLARQGVAATATIELGRAEALAFPDASFDAVLFLESPCHMSERGAFFREAFRVLKPGGRLVGEDWVGVCSGGLSGASATLRQIERLWAIPALGTASEYVRLMQLAGFAECQTFDLRDQCLIEQGFAVSASEQASLRSQIEECREPMLRLTLEGLLALGQAMAAGEFTVARFVAVRPLN
ncbi:MAG: hypothetical protein RI906_2858 [Pseudomonadota bacterium]